ncbi:bifunctional DNA-formamidopyrimidine glycosylase/DNA-(apurinic or apyrimidinic site) lyase [Plasticicumulans acidivorans]|uniref:Formamidopyrimidine-DNA glycosylase n=1 Tax=Plasticicumulans acidivorans TaxID=886464 RepID=A0A317MY37_9GAMM|nr:bifunctional DNA-formamidopyrimidine glycosylase/DNA-(apurinic or apyrimidinic site) lyase [Plasticicumulans acidivorans]PWV64523.1 DNA-(apurinic or apyrimidinic site) lyase [Plasticicumulans acidivorans]
MPELPEVETTRRGIAPHLLGHVIERVIVREPRLRWPVTAAFSDGLQGRVIERVERRGKYLLLSNAAGTALLHLGMSGSLRVLAADAPPGKHDHLDLVLDNERCLRLTDPRRFGAALWAGAQPLTHPLLAALGPEPLETDFTAKYLHARAAGRSTPIKPFLMDSHVVVGVGNIYASESLFMASIDPRRAAGRISLERCARLVSAIREVLLAAIEQGGTTLRDFVGSEGKPGYFRQRLQVYDCAGQPCPRCGTSVVQLRQAQRSTYFCPHCQR